MSRLRSNIWFGVTIIFAVGLITFSLYHIVLRPNHIVTELGGDGAKNNFTYLYQCAFGKGFWFDGMNYPYGEHIVYTDGQPLLSVPFTHFKNVTYGEALTVMWLLIALCHVIAILFVYKILLHFRLPHLAAMLFAGLICIFSPQLFRMQGHYALSYACVIPILFYWTIKYLERFSLRYPLYIFIIGCLTSFLHPYYAAMILVWTTTFAIGYFIFIKGSFASKIKYASPVFLSSVLVLAVVAIVMKITDPVTDRPASPYNAFYEACTHIKQIITSVESPVWLRSNGKPRFHFVSELGEGYSYVGIAVIIIAGASLIAGLIKSLRTRRVNIMLDTQLFSPIWLFMAFAALLFAMGVPFIWHMQWLFDYVSFFRQFRSLGRFSWIFYYIITIYAVVVLYTVYARYIAERKFAIAYTIMLLSFGLWSYEASGYINYSRKLSWLGIYNYDRIFSVGELSWPTFLAEHHYTADSFQAILVLPYFHIGTEKLWVSDPTWLITLGSKAALQLHLPMVDVMMSRSSWSQAMKQVKIAAGPYVDKPLLHDIKNNKPFLVLQFEEKPLNPDQQYLLDGATYLGHYTQCNIYAVSPDRIRANDQKHRESIAGILPNMVKADTVIGNDGVLYLDHYDQQTSGQHFFGPAGGPVVHHDDSVINTIPITTAPKDSELYEFSCWFLVGDKDFRTPYITLQLLNDSGRVIGYPDALTKESTDNVGMWFRASAYFYIHPNCRNIRCLLINKPSPTYIAMDEMLLRPAKALVISKSADGKVMVNNHLFNNSK